MRLLHCVTHYNVTYLCDSITTGSDAGSSQLWKCKHDTRSTSGIWPPSSKWATKSKTDDLNPVIISNTLNSTLNCIVDVMERTLDASAGPTALSPITSVAPPSITSSIEFQTTQLSLTPSQHSGPPSNLDPLSASASSEILDQATRIISAKNQRMSYFQLPYSSPVHPTMLSMQHAPSLLLATTTRWCNIASFFANLTQQLSFQERAKPRLWKMIWYTSL